MHTPMSHDSEPSGQVTPLPSAGDLPKELTHSHHELLEPVASTQSILLAWHQHDPRPVLWWLAVVLLFGVSLVLPINKDWSQPWVGGWYAYVMGLLFGPAGLVTLAMYLVRGGQGNTLSATDVRECWFLLTWFANPLCHIATPCLYPSPTKWKQRRARLVVVTGLAFALSLAAGLVNVGSGYASLQRSPAYFAWVGSMGALFLVALWPGKRSDALVRR